VNPLGKTIIWIHGELPRGWIQDDVSCWSIRGWINDIWAVEYLSVKPTIFLGDWSSWKSTRRHRRDFFMRKYRFQNIEDEENCKSIDVEANGIWDIGFGLIHPKDGTLSSGMLIKYWVFLRYDLSLTIGCEDLRTVGSIGELLIGKNHLGNIVIMESGHFPMENVQETKDVDHRVR